MDWQKLHTKLNSILPFRISGNPLSVTKSTDDAEGYLCISKESDELFGQAEAGKVVDRQTSEPPWIVVEQRPENIIWGSDWPIELWRVKIIKKIDPQNHAGSYTRCTSIQFLEHLPTFRLFGKNDSGVVQLVDYAYKIEVDDVNSLDKHRLPDSDKIYSDGWHRWIKVNDVMKESLNCDYSGTLLVPDVVHGSPVGGALTKIHDGVFERARILAPGSAFGFDEEDDTEYLIGAWQNASSALCDAALAIGSPSLFTSKEVELLIAPLLQTSPDFGELLIKNDT